MGAIAGKSVPTVRAICRPYATVFYPLIYQDLMYEFSRPSLAKQINLTTDNPSKQMNWVLSATFLFEAVESVAHLDSISRR